MSNIYNEIIAEIISRNPSIVNIELTEFSIHPPLQKRLEHGQSKYRIEKALKFREALKIPFWDAVLSTFLQTNNGKRNIDFELLNHASHHNCIGDILFFNSSNLDKINDFLIHNEEKNIALLSSVRLKNGEIKFIPMIDFHIFSNKKNEKVVEEILNILDIRRNGYLIDSGKSYHFISSVLFSKSEQLNFLARLILFTPIIDKNWIAHQLIEEKSALRITRSIKRQPVLIARYD